MRSIIKNHLVKVSKGFSDIQNPLGTTLNNALISSLEDCDNDGDEKGGCQAISAESLKLLINLT